MKRRQSTLSIFVAAMLMASLPVVGATITVNTTDDENNSDGDCSLREAIESSKTNASVDACTAGSGADVVDVPAGTYTLTLGQFNLNTTQTLTLQGAGARTTIINQTTAANRIFDQQNGTSLIVGVTLSGAQGVFGSAVWVSGGSMTVEDSRLIGNTAVSGGAAAVNDTNGASLTFTRVEVSGNTATTNYGAVHVRGGTFVANNSTFSGNTTPGNGGAIGVDNTGGGPSIATLNHVTVTGNTADSDGNGGSGGGLYRLAGTLNIQNSVVSGNDTNGVADDCSGTVTSLGYNVVGDTGAARGCPTGGTGDATVAGATNAVIDSLADNGGPSDTHAILAGGEAHDVIASGTSGCGTTYTDDQRGEVRPDDTSCDVGAFELQAPDVELSIATDIPAAELETVDVDVDFTGGGLAIAATTFSVDYDETCLSFDDTDGDADNIPDAMTFHTPGGFSITVFHDLGDGDGEIDVSIADLAPPIATLGDGALVTITFTSTCSPALGTTIVAPVLFSGDPAATFSDDLANDVAGTTTDGSVEIWPGPRGDCNGNGLITAADLIGDALEIFDGDGTFWADVVGGTFVGSPVGCDANDDTLVNAGDISCTILLIFGGNCGGAPFADPAEHRGFAPESSPILGLGKLDRERGRVWIPVLLSSGRHGISSVAFSLDLGDGVIFDPFDGDGDGLPDAVRFPGGRPDLVEVRYSAKDRAGELDLALADFESSFRDGVLIELAVEPQRRGALRNPAHFAERPRASFGNLFGQAVPGQAVDVSGRR